jgi:AmmeMemoRadiSam system protein B
MPDIREPRFAGSFYPENPEDLKKTIDSLLSEAGARKPAPAFGIIVPHAGIQYSGKTAACGFRVLKESDFDTLILIGPSHRASFPGVSVDLRKGWRTPLGIMPVNQELGKEIIEFSSSSGTIRAIPEVFDQEHSLEVEIPFIQRVSPNSRILPILIGDLNRKSCEMLAQALLPVLQKNLNDSIPLIASSDLYHGYNEKECLESDEKFLNMTQDFDIEPLARTLFQNPPPACGAAAIFTLMLVGNALGVKGIQVLHHTHTGEVTGDHSGYVVGYASIALFST